MSLHTTTSQIVLNKDNTFLIYCQQTLCDLTDVFDVEAPEILSNNENSLENPLLFTGGFHITEMTDMEVPEITLNAQELLSSDFLKNN